MTSRELPNEDWSLVELGDFCVARRNRLAEDAWWIGKAILLAKSKTKHGEFKAWKETHGFSDSIASRFMRLAEKVEMPEQIEGRKITEVLIEKGILPKPSSKKPASKLPAGHPSWAVKSPDDLQVSEIKEADAKDAHPSIPLPSLHDKLRYDLELSLPDQVRGLNATISAIMKYDKAARDRAWPVKRLADIKVAVQELRAALEQLEKEIPVEIKARTRKLSA